MAVGDYERLEVARRRAWLMARHLPDPAERAPHERRSEALRSERDRYLRDLLAGLPFRWHVEHAHVPRETAMHGGADHVVVDEEVRIGRLARRPGDALSRPRHKFWGLSPTEEGRLPSAIADIRIAERIAERSAEVGQPRKSASRLRAEVDRALRRR